MIEVRRAEARFPGQRSRAFTYSWKAIADEDFPRPDGTVFHRPAGTWVEHGTSIVALRDTLRRKFGRGITISEDWKP